MCFGLTQTKKPALLLPNSNYPRSECKRGPYGLATCDGVCVAGVEGVEAEEATPILGIGQEPQKIFTKRGGHCMQQNWRTKALREFYPNGVTTLIWVFSKECVSPSRQNRAAHAKKCAAIGTHSKQANLWRRVVGLTSLHEHQNLC
jgi:hypothetical protein